MASLRWTRLPSLEDPVAESCLLYLGGDLVLVGGSKAKFRYADDPSKVWVLLANRSEWRDDLLPRLRGPRTWQGCLLTNIGGEVSASNSCYRRYYGVTIIYSTRQAF